MTSRLAAQRQLVRYDERGIGLSDRDVPSFSFEAFVHDLETVVDEYGLRRFALLGISQGVIRTVTRRRFRFVGDVREERPYGCCTCSGTST